MEYLAHFFVAAMIGVLLDGIWTAGLAKDFYEDHLDRILANRPDPLPIVLFYFAYIWAVLYLIVEPALAGQNLEWVIKHAAALGFVIYATYNLTNAATLRHWSTKLTIVDTTWGIFLTVAVSACTFLIFQG